MQLWSTRDPFTLTVEQPRPTETNTATTQRLLERQDQYVNKLQSRALYITSKVDNKGVWPVNLEFCVDFNFFEPLIDLGFIENVALFAKMTDTQILAFLAGRTKKQKEAVIISNSDNIVAEELQTILEDTDSTVKTLFLFT